MGWFRWKVIAYIWHVCASEVRTVMTCLTTSDVFYTFLHVEIWFDTKQIEPIHKESMWVVFNLLLKKNIVTSVELLCHSQEFFSAMPNQQQLYIQLLAMLRVTISWFRFSVVSRIGECEIFYKLLTRWYPSVHLCRDTPATIPILRQCKLIYLPVPCQWVLCWSTWLCVMGEKCYGTLYTFFLNFIQFLTT